MEYLNFLSGTTRSSKSTKLHRCFSKCGLSNHFYFRRFPRLWNFFPTIDLKGSLSLSSGTAHLKRFFWLQFLYKFDVTNPRSFHFVCPCPKCSCFPMKCTSTVSLAYSCTDFDSPSYILLLVQSPGCQPRASSPSEQYLPHFFLTLFFLFLSSLFCKVIIIKKYGSTS